MVSTGKRKLLMRKNLYLVIEICHDDIKTVCINYSSKSFPADTLLLYKKSTTVHSVKILLVCLVFAK